MEKKVSTRIWKTAFKKTKTKKRRLIGKEIFKKVQNVRLQVCKIKKAKKTLRKIKNVSKSAETRQNIKKNKKILKVLKK